MTPLERDDLNHLLLSCRMRSDLSSGLRYAYARLDTIDRKSSELFRSFTFITGVVITLSSLLTRHGLHLRLAALGAGQGDPTGRSIPAALFYASAAATVLIALKLLITNGDISRLRYYRIGEAQLLPEGASDACRSDKSEGVMLGRDAKVDAVFHAYLADIARVTVDRESKLRVAAALYQIGVVCAAVCLCCILLMVRSDAAP